MDDKKVLLAIKDKDEKMMAFVIQKYSKLLWKIASGVLINAASASKEQKEKQWKWGDAIGKLGQTWLATGPNLYFAVYVEDETVNPLVE